MSNGVNRDEPLYKRLKRYGSNMVVANAGADTLFAHMELHHKFHPATIEHLSNGSGATSAIGNMYLSRLVGTSALFGGAFGIASSLIEMREKGRNRSNTLALIGNASFATEGYYLSRAFWPFFMNSDKIKFLSTRAAGFGAIADYTKAINYMLMDDKEQRKEAKTYFLLGTGNLGMWLFGRKHMGITLNTVQDMLWSKGFVRVPPSAFLGGGVLYWAWNKFSKED